MIRDNPRSSLPSSRWIACQMGFRDHYLVPRALHEAGVLHRALTELWVRPRTLLHHMGGQRLRERYHPDLANAQVESWNYRTLANEVVLRARGLQGWGRIIERNRWFQQRCVRRIGRLDIARGVEVTLFAYSYAAREIFELARSRGWRTILGQMDPGQYDERLMIEVYARHGAISGGWEQIPQTYWDEWRRECELADRIVVNSAWSRDALVRESVASEKIRVIPLAYEADASVSRIERAYPARFTRERPLRLLFLGQVNVRKGAADVLEALALLNDAPVHLTCVGPIGMYVPPTWRDDPRVRWVGYLPRSRALEHYRDADVFLFPSHSDGFGLTQLEAQARRLPIIASRFCGDVVQHERNGLILPEVSAPAIADALRRVLNDPALLTRFAANAVVPTDGGKDRYARALLSLD